MPTPVALLAVVAILQGSVAALGLDVPVVWSDGANKISWTRPEPFPLAWASDDVAILFFDEHGDEERRIFLDDVGLDADFRVAEIEGNSSGTMFAMRTELSPEWRAPKKLVLLDDVGRKIATYPSQGIPPLVTFSEVSRHSLVFHKGGAEGSRATSPIIVDQTGTTVAELPEAVYWDAHTSKSALYTWSFPGDCCETRLIFDIGGIEESGTLSKWTWDGELVWSTEPQRDGRNPAQFVVGSEGDAVLRYGRRWTTNAIVAHSGQTGSIVAERPISGEMYLMRGRTGPVWLIKRSPSEDSRVSVLDPQDLVSRPFVAPNTRSPYRMEGPVGDSSIAIASVPTTMTSGRIEHVWYAVHASLPAVRLGTGDPKFVGKYLLWKDHRGNRLIDVVSLF